MRISFARRSSATSRLSALISAFSSVVVPGRSPASTWARRSHLRTVSGDPIPSREGQIDAVSALSLLDLEPGDTATVSRVSDRDPEQLRYLGGLGLYPGATVSLAERLPFDGPLRIEVGGAEHVIGRSLAAAVHVVPNREP